MPTGYENLPDKPKVQYSHDALIDAMIAQPRATLVELAQQFRYAPNTVSRIVSSDAFRARLYERKKEIMDPVLTATVEERFSAMIHRSQEVLLEKLDAGASADLALKCLEAGSRALGYGARPQAGGTQLNAQFIVQVPAPAGSPQAWLHAHAPSASAASGGNAARSPSTTLEIRNGEEERREATAEVLTFRPPPA